MFRSAITLGALSVCFSLIVQVQAKPASDLDDLDHVNFEGVVTDSNKNVIAGASVFVRQTDTDKNARSRPTRKGVIVSPRWGRAFTNCASRPTDFKPRNTKTSTPSRA